MRSAGSQTTGSQPALPSRPAAVFVLSGVSPHGEHCTSRAAAFPSSPSQGMTKV